MGLLGSLRKVAATLTPLAETRVLVIHPTGAAYDPSTGKGSASVMPQSVPAMVEDYADSEIAAGMAVEEGVRVGDKKVTMAAAHLGTPPTTETKVEIQGIRYTVKKVDAVPAGGEPVYYVLRVRR